MSPLVLGLVIGSGLGLGCLLVAAVTLNRPRALDRVLPFVRSAAVESDYPDNRELMGLVDQLREPLRRRALRALNYVWGEASTTFRLEQAGLPADVERYRLEQLRWAAIGTAGAVIVGLLRIASGRPLPAVVWLLGCCFGALFGAALRDQALSRAASSRRGRIDAQLPAVAELLAFTVAAGLAPASALHRVGARLHGELADELRRCTDEIAAGSAFADALEGVAVRSGSAGVRRFVDGIVVAMERGTPISDVLRAQAMDARDAGHRALREHVGRRESYAVVPVVFLILPVVVVIAVYPGFVGLTVASN
ncbi:MAG: type II secretion system F family protein [Candidatus Nanopelagicales bacterium]